jgi:hypothetical protein
MGLHDLNRNQLAVTADQGSAAIAASTAYKLAIATTAAGSATSFTTTYNGWDFVAIDVVASTVPTLSRAAQATSAINAALSYPPGNSTTGETSGPPSFPFQAGSITVSSSTPFVGCAA